MLLANGFIKEKQWKAIFCFHDFIKRMKVELSGWLIRVGATYKNVYSQTKGSKICPRCLIVRNGCNMSTDGFWNIHGMGQEEAQLPHNTQSEPEGAGFSHCEWNV